MSTQSDIDRKREEVRQHLEDLESRVNPKKVADRVRGRARDSFRENPTPWFAAAVGGAVLVIGGVVAAVFNRR